MRSGLSGRFITGDGGRGLSKMAFPNTVSANLPGQFYQPTGSINRYMVNVDFGGLFHMMKSIDFGVTWAEVDAAHAPTQGGIDRSSCTDGSIIFSVSSDVTDGNVMISTFSMLTDLWIGTTVTANLIANSPNEAVIQVGYRAVDKKLVILGPVDAFKVGATFRVGYFLFDTVALTWGAWVKCGDTAASNFDGDSFGVVPGTGFMHLFMMSIPHPGLGETVVSVIQQSLSDANALGALQTVDSAAPVGGPTENWFACSDGATVVVMWEPDSTADATLFKIFQGASASTITFASSTLHAPAAQLIATIVCARSALAGTYAFVCWQDATFTFTSFGYFLNAGSGYGTLQTFGSLIVSPGPSAIAFASTLTNGGKWGVTMQGSAFYWEPAPAITVLGAPPVRPPQLIVLPRRAMCCIPLRGRCKDGRLMLRGKVIYS